MTGFLLVALAFAVFGALLINPKIGAILVWPIAFLYPHLYMQRLEILPWNIGVDDLFVCVFFLVVVVRRNLLGGTPLRIGVSMVGVLTYFLIWTVAHLSGWFMLPEQLLVDVAKPVLKVVIYVLFVYSMVHTIDNERDLRRSVLVYVCCMALAGLTVILHQLFPNQMVIFTSEKIVRYQAWYGGIQRSVGSLQSSNTGCALLGMAVLVAVVLIRGQAAFLGKVAVFACLPLLLIGMLLTESRSGFLALGSTLIVMGLLSRSRLYAWMVVACVCGFILFKPGSFLDFWERVVSVYNPEGGGQWGPNVQSRLDVWRSYFEAATPQIYLFGQGRHVATLLHGLHTHSTYVTTLFLHGIGGVIWFVVFFGVLLRRAAWLTTTGLEPYQTVAAAVFWAFVAWFVSGLTLDMLSTHMPRYVYLFYAVLIERSYTLAKQALSDGGLEQATQLAPPPAGIGFVTRNYARNRATRT